MPYNTPYNTGMNQQVGFVTPPDNQSYQQQLAMMLRQLQQSNNQGVPPLDPTQNAGKYVVPLAGSQVGANFSQALLAALRELYKQPGQGQPGQPQQPQQLGGNSPMPYLGD